MLKELTVRNFKSFNEEATFSMEADVERVSEYPEHVESINDNNLLKIASFYGPNGGGKTNLIKALMIAKQIQNIESYYLSSDLSCIFNDSNDFEQTIFFVTENYEIGYHYILNTTAENEIELIDTQIDTQIARRTPNRIRFNIIKEDIVYRKNGSTEFISLCSRNKDGVIFGENFLALFENKNFKLSKTMSIVKYVYDLFANNDNLLHEQLEIIKSLYNEIALIIPLESQMIIVGTPLVRLVKKHTKTLVELLNNLDIKISAIKFYERRSYPIYFERKICINGKDCIKELPLNAESKGTQKIFNILIRVLEYMDKGAIFYCDDMNAYLHPKLFKTIIELFHSNKSKSQLIFNSHDILNMNNNLFRRDEIWFAYRDDNYSTKLVPLSNIVNYKGEQVRKDAKYYKQYLEGKYGADPFISRGLNWNE